MFHFIKMYICIMSIVCYQNECCPEIINNYKTMKTNNFYGAVTVILRDLQERLRTFNA